MGDETFEERTGVVIVALPAADDPIIKASSEDIPHITMVWLGDASELESKNVTVDGLKRNLEVWAEKVDGPLTESVSGSATLGTELASVVLVDVKSLAEIREGMVTEFAELPERRDPEVGEDEVGEIARAFLATEQFPTWIPHVTLGYPDTPAAAEYSGTEITFDRLALWVGNDRTEYPMGDSLTAAAGGPVDDVAGNSVIDPDEGVEMVADEPIDGEDDDIDMLARIPFHGVAAPLGVESGDRRMFAKGSMSFRDMPLPLRFNETGTAHDEGVSIGNIEEMWIDDDDLVQYKGTFHPADFEPLVSKVIWGIVEGAYRGVSVEVDMTEIEVSNPVVEDEEAAMEMIYNPPVTTSRKARVHALAVVPSGAFMEAYIALGECDCPDEEIEVAELVASASDSYAPGTKDGPGWITHPIPTARIRRYWTKGKGAAKIRWKTPGDFTRCTRLLRKYVKNPDWLNGLCANMHKEATGIWPGDRRNRSITASAGEVAAPPWYLTASAGRELDAAWFKDPELTGPTPFTIDDDGRVFGHVATWGTCHLGQSGTCTTPPYSNTGYAYFRTGVVRTTEGKVPVGHITMETGHAGPRESAMSAAAHYDNTGAVVCDVAAGEDAYGIWVAGALRPGVGDEQRAELESASLSGDWRGVNGNLEMVAALAVNVPGFPIPRLALVASAEEQLSLVASGIVDHDPVKQNLKLQVGMVDAIADELEYRAARRDRITKAREAEKAVTRNLRIARAKGRG